MAWSSQPEQSIRRAIVESCSQSRDLGHRIRDVVVLAGGEETLTVAGRRMSGHRNDRDVPPSNVHENHAATLVEKTGTAHLNSVGADLRVPVPARTGGLSTSLPALGRQRQTKLAIVYRKNGNCAPFGPAAVVPPHPHTPAPVPSR
jgi:hypothetical protein